MAKANASSLPSLILGRCGGVFADQLIELLILWFVWELTRSSTIMGLATFAGRAPFWIFAFYGATLVDRFGPLRLLTFSNAAAASVAVAAALKLYLVGQDVVTFLLLAFVLNVSRSLEAAALASTVPIITDKAGYQKANSWFDNAKRIGRLSAPLLSRWIGVLHPSLFILLGGVAYGAMGIIASKVGKTVGNEPYVKKHPNFKAAFGFVRHSRSLLLVIGASGVYAFFHGIAYFIVLPRLAFDTNSNSPFSLGIILTLFGVGGILSNLVIAKFKIRNHLGAVGGGMIVVGFCFALLALQPPLEFRLALALLAGASLPFQDVFVTCAIQAVGPANLVARLHAIWRLVCEFTIGFGLLLGGPMVDLTSASLMGMVSGAAIILTGAVLFLVQNPEDAVIETKAEGSA